jgi:hypothetical protein
MAVVTVVGSDERDGRVQVLVMGPVDEARNR